MTAFNAGTLFGAALLCATFAIGSAEAQARSSGSVNGINYVVQGGSNQSITSFGDGLEVVTDGVNIRILPDTISVDGVDYPVESFQEVTVDQSGDGLRISVDDRDVMSISPAVALAARADEGDTDAMNSLAILLFDGDGVPADPVRAEQLIRAAAEAGNPHAQSNLANRLAFGLGMPENHEEAFVWAVRSADQGQAYGQYTAGRMLIYGIGTPVDPDRAIAYLESAAADGNGKAASELGYIFGQPIEVPVDYERAAEYYLRGIELADARSAFNYAALALETQGSVVSAQDGLAALDTAASLGWQDDTSALRARLTELQDLPAARFFYADGTTPVGPITLDQLRKLVRNETVTAQTLAWEGGTESWITIEELFALHN